MGADSKIRASHGGGGRGWRDMTDDERIFYAARIQSMMDSDGKLPHGALSILAKQAGPDLATMGRLKGRVKKAV